MGICVVWYISVLPRTEHYSPSYRKSDAETERKEEKMRRGALANSTGLGFNGAQMIYYLILRLVQTTKNCLKSLLI